MHSSLWYIFTFSIPFFGVAICSAGGVLCYRWARARRIGRLPAAVSYLVASLLPFCFAWLGRALGSYVAHSRQDYSFFGEETWALFTAMLFCAGLAIVANVALWIALAMLKQNR